MSKRATMNDIALGAGVSQATVSLVLNEVANARVSASTRRRVKELAASLGYTLKRGALTRGGTRVIALLIDDVTSTPFAAQLIEGARAEAALQGCIVAVICTGSDPETESAALQMLGQAGLVGVLYATLLTRSVVAPDLLHQVPSILLNCHDKSHSFVSVVPSDVAAGFAATTALIAAGHRRIAHLPGEDWGEAARDRLLGYRRALAAHDIAYDPALVTGPAWTIASGRDMTQHLLDQPDPPTAIFCFNDRVAIGCYDALERRGLSVPRDMSVVGFDNDDLAANLQPPLSTMVLPHDEMARWAVAQVLNPDKSAPRRFKVECEFLPRGSIAAPRRYGV